VLKEKAILMDSSKINPCQDVPAQGILGEQLTCATTSAAKPTLAPVSGASQPAKAETLKPARRFRRRATVNAASAAETTAKPVGASGRAPGTSASTAEAEAVRRVAMQPQSSDAEELRVSPSDSGGSADEDSFRSPQEMEAEASAAPSCSAVAGASGGTGVATGGKRKTEVGSTPSQPKRKKPKRASQLGGTFKQAEKDNLLGVILIKDNPYDMLSRTQLQGIRGQLTRLLDESIDSGGPVPRFQESGIRNGRFHLSCADRESFEWLSASVISLEVTGDNSCHQLALVAPSQVPKLLRAAVNVPGPSPGVPRFLTRIRAQNPDLHTERWSLRFQQTRPQSLFMVWGIDEESACQLEAINFQPHYGLGRVTFQVARPSALKEAGQ